MKLGMPTLLECKDLFTSCEVASQNGLDFVEINMSFPQYLPSALDARRVREEAGRLGLTFTIHADEQLNPFDFNKSVSECYFGVMRDTIRFALEIGAPVINMHLLKGVYVTLPDRVVLLNDVYRGEYLERVDEFIKMCEKEIGDGELKIAIENVDSNPFTESQLDAISHLMKSDKFALTLDTGHELCLNFCDSHVFEEYPQKLIHMHLHDAIGRSAHLPLGEGCVNVREKLSMLGDSGTCLIEVKNVEGLKKSIEYLKM